MAAVSMAMRSPPHVTDGHTLLPERPGQAEGSPDERRDIERHMSFPVERLKLVKYGFHTQNLDTSQVLTFKVKSMKIREKSNSTS